MSFLAINIKNEPHQGTLFLSENNSFFELKNKNQSIVILLKKRQAYPGTYADQIDQHTFHIGYGDKKKGLEKEYLDIIINDRGELSIERDRYTTLPLIYGYSQNIFVIDNEYKNVVETLPHLTPFLPGILESLAITKFISRPPIKEIHVLWEKEKLFYKNGHVRIIQPADRAWKESSMLPITTPTDFKKYFDKFLDRFITTRLQGQNFAFQVSGGIDSATLPQYYAKKYGKKTPLASLLYSDKAYRKTQQEKLNKLTTKTRGKLFSVVLDPKKHFPLARMILSDTYLPTYYEEIYAEASMELFKNLEKEGIQVTADGSGADQLFGHIGFARYETAYGVIERNRRREKRLPPFLTEKFRVDYIKTSPPHALNPLLSQPGSTIYKHLGNNTYISHNIWPVSPFADPDLYEICQGLPYHLKKKKDILRAYHYAYGFIPEIYNPIQNEYFDTFFNTCFQSGVYDDLLKQLSKNSITAGLGYVNLATLLAIYTREKSHVSPEEDDFFFRIYLWLCTEINLQYSKGLTTVS